MEDLKGKTIRGGFARLAAQVINFLVRLGSIVVLARLLEPGDFGLIGMVTVFTGVLGLFRDFGLSAAAIQRGEITEAQASTLFWINVFVGVALACITAVAAPVLVAFYKEPKLLAVSLALASGFIFNAAGVQHGALLQREMRFMELTVANTGALVLSAGVAIASAAAGFGYWALVIMAVVAPIANTLALWFATRWIPGSPARGVGMAGLARFGGTVTTNGVMYYAACNFDKMLIGRVWGGEALGLYGRAYQLINFPAEGIYGAAGEVAFSALSRIQNDAERLRKYFLSGYSLLLTLTIPITVACGIFAEDIVLVALGRKWVEAAPIFRMLAPAMVGLAIVNPLSWLLVALGMVGRSLRMGLVISPALVVAFLVGVPYGPLGIATAYSAVMVVWALPAVVWAMAGTPVAARDVFIAIARPACASALGGAAALALRPLLTDLSALPRLTVETAILFALFAATLLFGFGQKRMFMELLRPMMRQDADDDRLAKQGSTSL